MADDATGRVAPRPRVWESKDGRVTLVYTKPRIYCEPIGGDGDCLRRMRIWRYHDGVNSLFAYTWEKLLVEVRALQKFMGVPNG